MLFVYDCDTHFVNLPRETLKLGSHMAMSYALCLFKCKRERRTVRATVNRGDGNNFQCGSGVLH